VDGTGWVLVGIIHEMLKLLHLSLNIQHEECWASTTAGGAQPHTITVNLSCRMMLMLLPAIASSLFLDQEQQAAKGTRKRPTNNNAQGCCMMN
jgi:hypothetical protein